MTKINNLQLNSGEIKKSLQGKVELNKHILDCSVRLAIHHSLACRQNGPTSLREHNSFMCDNGRILTK